VAFWTWVWGPIGLALATPLTVCVVVLAKYVPGLEFIQTLMSDEPVMEPPLVLYQRLVAMDKTEPLELVQEYVRTRPPEELYDGLLLPALLYAKQDSGHGKLTQQNQQFILEVTKEILENYGVQPQSEPVAPPASALVQPETTPSPCKVRLLGIPTRDAFDELGLQMLQKLLGATRCEMDVISSEKFSGETFVVVGRQNPDVVCMGAVPPTPRPVIRALTRRVREQFPNVKLVVGYWDKGDQQESATQEFLEATGADAMGRTLLESRNQIQHLIQVLSSNSSEDMESAPRGEQVLRLGA
jgi:hypothetical protein